MELDPWQLAAALREFFSDPQGPARLGGSELGPGWDAIAKAQFYWMVWRFWDAPVRPTFAQTAEMFHLFDTAPRGRGAATLLRRGYAIQKDLETATGAYRHRLLGALSSLSMVLAIETNYDVVGYFGSEGGAPLR